MTKAHRKRILRFSFLKGVSFAAFILTFAILIMITVFILIDGLPHLSMQLLFGDYGSRPSVMPAIIGTACLILISVGISAPAGIGCAIYLTEYLKPASRFVKITGIAMETLAGIPSIVYGIFGYLLFVVTLRFRYSLLAGGITLAIMILPVIVRSTEENLRSVPVYLREGSYALGASRVRTVFSVVLPSAAGGIFTSLILAAGRVISESAVLILTAGMVVNKIPDGIMSPGTSLALDIYFFSSHGYPEEASATAVVLLVLVISINITTAVLGRRFSRRIKADGA